MKEIPLRGGKTAIVDDNDYEWLMQWKWGYHYKGYAVGAGNKYMHRMIARAPKGKTVDHINRDKLDNRKENLRICKGLENYYNRDKPRHNTSGYKGVALHKPTGLWRAIVKVNGKQWVIGHFKTARIAALAYDLCAPLVVGDFIKTNFASI